MSEIGVSSHLQIDSKTTFFQRLRSLTTIKWSSLQHVFETKHDIGAYIIGQLCCKLQIGLYIISKRHEHWFTNGIKMYLHFTHPPLYSAFYCTTQASQTKISKQSSTKLCQTVNSKSR